MVGKRDILRTLSHKKSFNVSLFSLTCFFLILLPHSADYLIIIPAWVCALLTLGIAVSLQPFQYEKLQKIALMLQLYVALFALIVLVFSHLSELFVHVNAIGLEDYFYDHPQIGWALFFAISFFQPIALPLPEAATVVAGSAVFGPLVTFVIAYIGTVCGMLVMFQLVRLGREHFFGGDKTLKLLHQYDHMVDQHGLFFIIVLCMFPLLPDEVICVGAGISRLPFLTYLAIVLACKGVTLWLLSYSFILVDMLGLSKGEALIGLVVLLACYLIIKYRRKQHYHDPDGMV
jgi:uncharacterized membrane protein YdjX (TVP38/TMEM64 family)